MQSSHALTSKTPRSMSSLSTMALMTSKPPRSATHSPAIALKSSISKMPGSPLLATQAPWRPIPRSLDISMLTTGSNPGSFTISQMRWNQTPSLTLSLMPMANRKWLNLVMAPGRSPPGIPSSCSSPTSTPRQPSSNDQHGKKSEASTLSCATATKTGSSGSIS